ncbi:MAG: hydantoinase B/oxoprolinase family protein [Solirubrobacteraceae bacterium]|nr:hydantoinase B/oxoprolinase family protein [Solirubrobacteraceae bacterium]
MEVDIDKVTLTVMANRINSIVMEMTNTMVRTARSTTMAARDFSCSITSHTHEMLSFAEAAPVHVYGSGMLAQDMEEFHPEFQAGDVFMSNDPYGGNSHTADQTLLVPVFLEGVHLFTALAKAHQADIGNAIPTTYSPTATDVYNEGALVFPMILMARGGWENTDVLRMCERRIRSYETWYGDYLATLGAVRLAERRLKELAVWLGGVEETKAYLAAFLDYCEQMAGEAISELPAGRIVTKTELDPFPQVPEGIKLQATIDVDPDAGKITVDLRDNPDCVPAGLNLTESTAKNAATTGVLIALNSKRDAQRLRVYNNAGAFRRIEVLTRENCVVGKPRHPASASCATTTVQCRTVGMTLIGMAALGDGYGATEPAYGSAAVQGVLSGHDPRREGNPPFMFQIFAGTQGGPATPESDGWLTFLVTGGCGINYIDNSEVLEQKYPIVLWERSVWEDSEGAGRTRGAPGNVCIYGPRFEDMEVQYFHDGVVNRIKGVHGGSSPMGPEAWNITTDGAWSKYPYSVGEIVLEAGESIVSLSAGGGGYGNPLDRSPEAVLVDAVEGFVSVGRAQEVYGVVITGDPERWETLAIDEAATAARRAEMAAAGPLPLEADDASRAVHPHLDWWAAAA